MYDRSIRVPLIIYDPRVKEHRDITDMALNIDVTATIVDLAGIDIPASYHGQSLVQIVTGETETLSRDAVLIERVGDAEGLHDLQPPVHHGRHAPSVSWVFGSHLDGDLSPGLKMGADYRWVQRGDQVVDVAHQEQLASAVAEALKSA